MDSLIPITALIATFIFAFTSLYGKLLIDKFNSAYHFFLIQIFFTSIFLLLLFFILSPDITNVSNLNYLFTLQISSIFAFVGLLSLYKGFEIGNVSVGGVMLSARVLITIPLAILIGERYEGIIYMLVILGVFGSLLVSWTKDLPIKKLLTFQSAGMGYFLITLFSWSIANSLVRKLEDAYHPLLFLFIRIILFMLYALVTYPILNRHFSIGKIRLSKNTILHVILYSIIMIIGQGLFIWSLGKGLLITEGIGVFEGVITFFMAIVLSLSIPFFKNYLKEPLENETLVIRSIGAIITTISTLGVVFLSV